MCSRSNTFKDKKITHNKKSCVGVCVHTYIQMCFTNYISGFREGTPHRALASIPNTKNFFKLLAILWHSFFSIQWWFSATCRPPGLGKWFLKSLPLCPQNKPLLWSNTLTFHFLCLYLCCQYTLIWSSRRHWANTELR